MPTLETSSARELDRLDAALVRVDALLALPEARLRAVNPDVSGWSSAEHLFHLSLANELSLQNATSLVEGKGLLRRPLEPRDPRADDYLLRGRLPAGTEAPRFVRPPARFELGFVREMHAGVRALAAALAEHPARVDEAPDGIPHQALGVLPAPLWLRFARMHTAHHLRIVRRVLS